MQIFEKNPTTIKNFGIWVRYMSRTGFHNAYKEYRDVTLNGAVEQMYQARLLATDVHWSFVNVCLHPVTCITAVDAFLTTALSVTKVATFAKRLLDCIGRHAQLRSDTCE